MEQSLIDRNVDEILTPSNDFGGLVEEIVEPTAPAYRLRSYHPTPWAIVNRILDIVDNVTKGRADWVVRFFSYIFFGGTAAVVNLIVFYVALNYIPLHMGALAQNIFASALACEISLVANFIPNDYFTFRHMPGRERSWGARCARFHLTSLVGSGLTILIQLFFSHIVHIHPFLGQALALIIVLFYNFSFHHLFTYRHIKTATAVAH
jgi:putative flippase GtrA